MKDLLKIQYHVHGQALRSYGAVPAVLSTHTCIAMQRLIKQGSASSIAEPLLETKMFKSPRQLLVRIYYYLISYSVHRM